MVSVKFQGCLFFFPNYEYFFMTVRTGQSIMFILCHIVPFHVSLTLYQFTPSIFSKYYSNTTIKAGSKLLKHGGGHNKYFFFILRHICLEIIIYSFHPRM